MDNIRKCNLGVKLSNKYITFIKYWGIRMYKNSRNSGIENVGKIHWGTHIAHLFKSKGDYFDVIVPCIKTGLINNELCLFVYSNYTDYKEIISTFSDSIDDIDKYIESGQLVLMSYKDWYLKDNSFNEFRVNNQWKEYVDKALDNRFDGLRAVADTSWLEKSFFRTFQNYEKKANYIIPDLQFIAICLYDANKLDIFEVAEITKNHGYLIGKKENKMEVIENVELLVKNKQLEQSRKKHEDLLELLPISVIIHDDNRIYYCNKSALDLIGEKSKDYACKGGISRFINPQIRHSSVEYIGELIKGNKNINYLQSKIHSVNGAIKNVEIVSTKYNYNGRQALLSVIRDLTPFNKIDKLKRNIEKNRELLNYALEYDKIKNEFIANVSHELRTPINIIMGTIQLLELSENSIFRDVPDSKYLKIMKQNCLRLVRLVNNILDLTKIDSDYFEINKQNCDIVRLVEDITMSIVDYSKNKGIDITFDTNVEEKLIACDPAQIERVVLNLLSNAVKFTQDGGKVLVTVNDYGEKIRIIVKDNGVGIPPEKQKNIFNRFEQVDKSLTREYEGSGIGLSIVQALVEKHNGNITLNSKVGRGSEFIIELPCETLMESESLQAYSPNLYLHNYQDHIEKIRIEFSDIYMN